MQIHNEAQGSEQWLNLRKKYLTASDSSAVMGLSKYKTRMQLLHEKATGEREEVSDSTAYIFQLGHECEDAARPIIEEQVGEELFPVVGSIEYDGLPLMASFDGLNMDETIGFEHKLASAWRLGEVRDGVLTQDIWQLEHQILVSGAEKIIFAVSNLVQKGDKHQEVESLEYVSQPKIRKRLVEGLKLFQEDLANYVPPEKKADPDVKVIKALPPLKLEMTGKVKSNTIKSYAKSARSYLKAINTELKNDNDFANAELDIKACKEAEALIKTTKDNAVAGTVTVKEAVEAFDSISEDFRKMRLKLEKLVKLEKEARKEEIIQEANTRVIAAIKLSADETKPYVMPQLGYDFYQAAKNKRNLDKIQAAVDTELNDVLIRLSGYEEVMLKNIALLNDLNPSARVLFADFNDHIMLEESVVESLINDRLAQHEKQVQEELEEKNRRDAEVLEQVEQSIEQEATEQFAEYDPTVVHVGENSSPDPTEFPDEHTAEVVDIALTDKELGEATEELRRNTEQAKKDAMNAAYFSMGALGFDKETAKKVVSAIEEGLIHNVKLEF